MARIVVLGASFAGLLAGAAASRAGHDVTVLERDIPPAEAVARDGVPQGRQPHVLLHRGLMAIEELLPGIEQELLALGGVRFNTGMMPWLGEYGWMPQRDWAYEIISLSRPLLELAVRERVGVLPHVELRNGVTATGLRHDTAGWEVLVRDGSPVTADVVVDASGRSSRLPQWLGELGVQVPEPEVVEARVGYASRTYRGRGPLRTGIVVAATPATQSGALALAIEDDRWLISAVGFGDRRPGRTPAEFEAFLAGLRDPAMVELTSFLEPESDVAVHRQTGNRRYAYGRVGDWRPGLLVVGDAMCAFNPVYGQGITVAACQAELLAAALREPPTTLAGTRRLQRRLGAVAGLPWSVATSEDLRMPSSEGQQSRRQRLASLWTRRLAQLVTGGDEACTRAFTAVYHLMGSPLLLFSPRVVRAAALSLVHGVPQPAPRPTVLDALRVAAPDGTGAESGETGGPAPSGASVVGPPASVPL